MTIPSWIFNYSICPCPSSSQYRIRDNHAGCTSPLARVPDVRWTSMQSTFVLAIPGISPLNLSILLVNVHLRCRSDPDRPVAKAKRLRSAIELLDFVAERHLVLTA